jgi:hypothetical protein
MLSSGNYNFLFTFLFILFSFLFPYIKTTYLFSIGKMYAVSILSTEGPEVKGTLDVVLDDASSHSQVSPEMRTVSICTRK